MFGWVEIKLLKWCSSVYKGVCQLNACHIVPHQALLVETALLVIMSTFSCNLEFFSISVVVKNITLSPVSDVNGS